MSIKPLALLLFYQWMVLLNFMSIYEGVHFVYKNWPDSIVCEPTKYMDKSYSQLPLDIVKISNLSTIQINQLKGFDQKSYLKHIFSEKKIVKRILCYK